MTTFSVSAANHLGQHQGIITGLIRVTMGRRRGKRLLGLLFLCNFTLQLLIGEVSLTMSNACKRSCQQHWLLHQTTILIRIKNVYQIRKEIVLAAERFETPCSIYAPASFHKFQGEKMNTEFIMVSLYCAAVQMVTYSVKQSVFFEGPGHLLAAIPMQKWMHA